MGENPLPMLLDSDHQHSCTTKGLASGGASMVQRLPLPLVAVEESRHLVRAGVAAGRGVAPTAAEQGVAPTAGRDVASTAEGIEVAMAGRPEASVHTSFWTADPSP